MRHVWPDFHLPSLPPSPILCAWRCVWKTEKGGWIRVTVSGRGCSRKADLYRLATHVHRGHSASSRKCVYKWGSYFYCFLPLHKVTILQIFPLYLTLLLFWSILLLFLALLSSHYFFCWTLKLQKLVLGSFLPTMPGFQDSLHSIGKFSALVSPLFDTLSHGQLQALRPMFHMTFSQLSFYLSRASF